MASSVNPTRVSDFFYTPPTPTVDSLAILHLKRDSLVPVILRETSDDGYAEGAVTNTRFGSFPHSTIVGTEWGSQLRASKVDTGSRGRKGPNAKLQDVKMIVEEEAVTGTKRKSAEESTDTQLLPNKKLKQDGLPSTPEPTTRPIKAPLEAGSGFVHVLPPTPESWTSSLDHRTQVVYTPDYSYILQRLRVRPGSTIIEAGAGSGSFTHAALRAVFSGYPDTPPPLPPSSHRLSLPTGRVYSYEYHEPRVHTLRAELVAHGLDPLVTLTHRDVCVDGFGLPDAGASPRAEAIFLDLPAPWTALPHLTRADSADGRPSPLAADRPVHICTFSPCIEQVMATVAALRRHGWTDVAMVEVRHRRLDVRRERIGLREEGLRGVNASAANVEEALGRLREDVGGGERKTQTRQQRLDAIKKDAAARKLYKEGRLVHRTEPEVRNHTSYLVFAILPQAWTEEDERRAEELYPISLAASVSKEKNTQPSDDI